MEKPLSCIWEITMQCDMQCKHCGSSCAGPLADELTTGEALALCDELRALRLDWITLTGGEPFMRRDWPLIARRLAFKNTDLCIVSNGKYITGAVAGQLKESHVRKVAVSIDGTRPTHDAIRAKGNYEQCLNALNLLREAGIDYGVNTTVLRENISELPAIRDILIKNGVLTWQLQIGIPMGNCTMDSVIHRSEIQTIIDFAYEETQRGLINIQLSDCIGYYTRKEILVRQKAAHTLRLPVWAGCNAGLRTFGILANGDITACTSMRNPEFVAGNIRERRLMDIWDDDRSFAWRRNMTPDDLGGYCRECVYAHRCLGGCSNMRLAINGTLASENTYCVYHWTRSKTGAQI